LERNQLLWHQLIKSLKMYMCNSLLPIVCHFRSIQTAQDYGVKENMILQDNKSAILLEKNGKALSSKRTKHISVRYFFVMDMVKKDRVSIDWCPADDMIADFWTEPEQGAMFARNRELIMGKSTLTQVACKPG
jgi:hypothetical protein